MLLKHKKEGKMELRVLRYFLAVVREGSITKAADFLHVTQPTLSRQLKDLEEELGQQLFIRGSRQILLTAEGMMLRRRAEEILDMVARTEEEFDSAQKNVAGDVYIGGGETRAMCLIAEVIGELRRIYPDIRYHLYSGNAMDVTERLDKGLLDFGILIEPTDLLKYDFLPFPVKDVWGVLMPENCALAKKSRVTKNDLEGLPLICSRQVVSVKNKHNEFLNWFGNDFGKMNIIADYNLVYNAALLAEQGIGYVVTLDGLADAMDNNVCFRPLEPKLESGLNIVWKKYQVFSPAAKIFLEALRQKFLRVK